MAEHHANAASNVFEFPTHMVAGLAMPVLPEFSPMLQGPGSNMLARVRTRTGKVIAPLTQGDLTVSFAGEAVIRPSTHKLLDALVIEFTAANTHRGKGNATTAVSLSLNAFMELCGKPLTTVMRNAAAKRVRADLKALTVISIEWREHQKNSPVEYQKMRVLTSAKLSRGKIRAVFSDEFADYLRNAYVMMYHHELFKVDDRNPNSYYLGRRLLLHRSIRNNVLKGTAEIIRVSSLLEACPNIRPYEEVASKSGAVTRDIINPFKAALDSLNFVTWEFTKAKGVALTEDEKKSMSYDDFSSLFVKFHVPGFPDTLKKSKAQPAAEGDVSAEDKPSDEQVARA